MPSLKKIVIIGPESTGKSTLCARLAQHYNTTWVPEFARSYLEKNGMEYTYESLLIIAKGQLDLEETYTRNQIRNQNPMAIGSEIQNNTRHPFLFIDTDMYVMKVWCEFVFDKCYSWILNQAATRKYDLYLLCNIDLPWVKDNLREYPDLDMRSKLYRHYEDIMVNQHTPWIDISGDYEQRFTRAVQGIDAIISRASYI